MDDRRFDALSRAVASRRGRLGGWLALCVPITGDAKPKRTGTDTPAGPNATRCVANGRRCGKGSGNKGKKDQPCKKCCSKHATPKSTGPQRCSCKPATAACTNGAQCGPCQPGLTACAGGCVDTQTSDAHRGSCGAACADGQACQSGACTCGGQTCDGCCDETTCKTGNANAVRGTNGGTCQVCAGVNTCSGGCAPLTACPGGQTCGAAPDGCGGTVTCTGCDGCCDGAVCRAGTIPANCGSGGDSCQTCPLGDACDAGRCTVIPCGEPGGRCRVFTTSAAYFGDLGGLGGADAKCQALADVADLPGVYYAWLSDDTGSPSSRFPLANSATAGPYVLVDETTTVADDWADLTSGTIRHAIDQTESGGSAGSVWSNTTTAGTLLNGTGSCLDWTSAAFGRDGNFALSSETDGNWTHFNPKSCGRQGSPGPMPGPEALYCFQQG